MITHCKNCSSIDSSQKQILSKQRYECTAFICPSFPIRKQGNGDMPRSLPAAKSTPALTVLCYVRQRISRYHLHLYLNITD